jgi:thiamine pyrophosphate-dependent acetolactate synthase large subunit-like protein
MATSANDLNADHESCAAWIARFLKARSVDRIFGLQGGHIQPIWDHAAQLGIRIIDVRHEVAAVHMAHAHAEVTGELGVAMVTAGPGVTNTVTGIANASLARMPVLVIGGCTSRAQANLGPLQDIPHVDIIRPIARQSRTLRVPDQVIREFDEGGSRAFGDLGEPGPVYLELPTDVLRARSRMISPDEATVARTVDALWSAKRPLVVTGRGRSPSGPRDRAASRRTRRRLSRHAGEPGVDPRQSSRGGRRDARGGDDGSRHRLRDRPQA